VNKYRLDHGLEWVSEYAAQTYTTPDSGLTYIDCDQITETTSSFTL